MMFAGGGVAHQEIGSNNWQLRPSVFQEINGSNEEFVPDISTDTWNPVPDEISTTHQDDPGPRSGGGGHSGLVIRLPPLSAFPRLSSLYNDSEKSLVPDDEEPISDSEQDETSCESATESDQD